MTSKEIIRRIINHDQPPRIGYDFNAPYESDIYGLSSCKLISPEYDDKLSWGSYPDIKALVPNFKGEVHYDQFGNIHGRLKNDARGECIKGKLQEDFDKVNTYEFPKIDMDYNNYLKTLNLKNNPKFVMGGIPLSAFSTFRDIRLMENALMDILIEPENTKILLGKVLDKILEIVDLCGQNGFDGIMMADDWGMQHATFISPAAFKEFFKPLYRAIAEKAHSYDMKYFVHSCGLVYDFIEDFIDAGVDVMQFDQPELSGSHVLAEEFGSRMTFHCPVDIQKIMTTGDRKLIEEGAYNMVNTFKEVCGGSLIAKDYPTWDSIAVGEEWATWARNVMIKQSSIEK